MPVSNIWELTEPKWKGKVALVDPLTKSTYTDWFNQMEAHGDDKVAAAYKAHFGKDCRRRRKVHPPPDQGAGRECAACDGRDDPWPRPWARRGRRRRSSAS